MNILQYIHGKIRISSMNLEKLPSSEKRIKEYLIKKNGGSSHMLNKNQIVC